jgi:hypothetical protein
VAKDDRRAKNEALFREANERIKEISSAFADLDPSPIQFVCECARAGCTEPLALTLDEYEAVREVGTYFFVVPGHQDPVRERVVEIHDSYVIVEKIGEAAATASERDPRS